MTDIKVKKKRASFWKFIVESIESKDWLDQYHYCFIRPCDIKVTKAELRKQREELRKCATDNLN